MEINKNSLNITKTMKQLSTLLKSALVEKMEDEIDYKCIDEYEKREITGRRHSQEEIENMFDI